jgi:hypothetical protein
MEQRCGNCNAAKCKPKSCANIILDGAKFFPNGLPKQKEILKQESFERRIFSNYKSISPRNRKKRKLEVGIIIHSLQNWVPADWQPENE